MKSRRQLASIQPNEQSAKQAVERLLDAGIPRACIRLISPRDRRRIAPRPQRRVSRDALTGTLFGVGGGLCIGVLTCGVLALFQAPFLVDQPLYAALTLLSYPTLVGALVGGLVGIRAPDASWSGRIVDRVDDRRWAVVVHAEDTDQRELAARALYGHPSSAPRPAA